MMEKTARIKGMVCRRCIATVKDIFMQEGFLVTKIDLGEVRYQPQQPDASFKKVEALLSAEGFELLDDKQSRLIAKVKELVEGLWQEPENKSGSFSALIAETFHK